MSKIPSGLHEKLNFKCICPICKAESELSGYFQTAKTYDEVVDELVSALQTDGWRFTGADSDNLVCPNCARSLNIK